MRRRASHETLTDKGNAHVLATLTAEAWAELAMAQNLAQYLDPETDISKLPHPMEGLVEIARNTSGSIHGEARKGLERAVTTPAPVGGLLGNVPITESPPANNGNGHVPVKKRGGFL